MKRLLLALALLLIPAAASAQCNGVFANNTVCGNVTGTGNLPRPTSPAAFLGAAGGTNGQTQYNNGGALGGYTPSGDVTVNSSTGVETIQPGVVDSGKIANNAVTNGKLATNALPTYASRTAAAAVDLSTFSVIQTLGYATAGDGGGATFQKQAGGTAFTDQYITAATVAGGSGYGANTTYKGVPLSGGTGLGCAGKVTVSGGAVTVIDITGTLCPGYKVGDVLTPNNANMAGTGTGASYTVTTISTVLGSFTDSAANLWQIITDAAAFPNPRQFSAKGDWNGVDGSATNDLPAFKAAMAFAMYPKSSTAALVNGTGILISKGAYYLCAGTSPFSTMIIPQGVALKGGSPYGAVTLKQCAGENSAAHFITLCDPNAQSGQFGCRLEDLSVIADGSSSSNVAAVYSNSGQQFSLLKNVYIQPGLRGCIRYEIGAGGASNAIFDGVDCEQDSAATNIGLFLNSSNTQVVVRNAVFGCAPSICGAGTYAIGNSTGGSGNLILENFHIEGHQVGVNLAGSDLSTIRNGTITSDCTNGITLQSTNTNNTVLIENIQSSCSVNTVLNGHTSGANVSGSILAQQVFNP